MYRKTFLLSHLITVTESGDKGKKETGHGLLFKMKLFRTSVYEQAFFETVFFCKEKERVLFV